MSQLVTLCTDFALSAVCIVVAQLNIPPVWVVPGGMMAHYKACARFIFRPG